MACEPKTTAPSKRQELVTKAIFDALLRLDEVKNLEIRHNVKIKGIRARHQIDVFWKFQAGGIDHFVIVEVKKGAASRARRSD